MAIFIGGDTQELEYDFGLKVANSTLECPMKIYKQEVDPDNLPDPTTGWTEVTSQTVLDKLKSQNELTVSAIATDHSTVTWNGKTLPKTTTLKVVDDFVGKVSGSIVENPHRAKVAVASLLKNPSEFNTEFVDIDVFNGYGKIKTSGDSSISNLGTGGGVNQIPQQLFSFNIIEMFERKYGAIPKETVVEKVNWLRNNLRSVVCRAYIYGSGPLGNKAYLNFFSNSIWSGPVNNTATSPSILAYGIPTAQIQDDGFVHFLAYTDAARTTDETLLVLTGHGLSQYDIIENTTRGKAVVITSIPSSNVLVVWAITDQTSGDTVKKYHVQSSAKTITVVNGTTITIPNHGLSATDNSGIHFIKKSGIIDKIQVVDTDTLTMLTTNSTMAVNDSVSLYYYTETQTAGSTIIPSTIYTDYVSLELTLKAPENLITATNTLSDIVTDFTGKVSGSVSENANISKVTPLNSNNSTLLAPSSINFAEINAGGSAYGQINTLNSVVYNGSTNINGAIPQQLFSFNIVSAVEKQLGQPIPAVDKVQWCKDNIYRIAFDWTGYGSCPSGNKSYLDVWRNDLNVWALKDSSMQSFYSTTSGTPTTSSFYAQESNNLVKISNSIDNNGMFNLLAYTDASDGVTASTIYTDYVKLTIKLKYIPTYDFFTDSNTRRDAGLTDIVLVKRQIGDMTSDFTGKVSGSVSENANITKHNNLCGNTVLLSPSSFTTEGSNTYYYDKIKTLNDSSSSVVSTILNAIPQQLFQFNLIEIAEKQLGTSIPGADTASKIQWLKDNLNNIKCDWTGYGSCPSGNRARFARALNTGGYSSYDVSNVTHTANTPTVLSCSSNSSDIGLTIFSDGMYNLLAYTDASDGVTPSVINTDYVKLTLTFKSDTVGYEYFTNNSAEIEVTTNAKASAYLIECDLTPIATALFGGSNSALKSALKSIQTDVYAMGSGANVNQLGYGCKVCWYVFPNYVIYTRGSNSTSFITDICSLRNLEDSWITSSNKFYILIYSTYKSDGVIASEVNLDYVNIKIKLSRTPDVISNPPTINLTDTWSMLVRGFSPAWDSTDTKWRDILRLVKDTTNYFQLIRNGTTESLRFNKVVSSVADGSSINPTPQTFNKYQVYNILLEQNPSGMAMRILKNNGTVEKIANTTSKSLTGNVNMYILQDINNYQADAFLDSIVYMPNQVFDGTTAEAILRGTQSGFEFPELLNTALNTTQTVNVLPNNQYQLKTNVSTVITEMYNNIVIKTSTVTADTVFTTSSHTNKIKFDITGSFSCLSLKLKM